MSVLKILQLYSLRTVRRTVAAAEQTLYRPQPSFHGECYGAQSAQQFVVRAIQNVTFQPVANYERCPLDLGPSALPPAPTTNPSPSDLLYLKCKKSMLRLLPDAASAAAAAIEDLHDDDADGDGDGDGDGEQQRSSSTERETERETVYRVLEGMVAAVQMVFQMAIQWLSSNNGAGDAAVGVSAETTSYFADRADNILMLRFIVGALEQLFGIEPSKQEELMNQTIMWEPSQSASRSPALTLPGQRRERGNGNGNGKELGPDAVEQRGRSVWARPQGEWEWFWALKFHRFVYGLVLQHGSDRSRRFYLKYVSWFHRSFGADVRALGWYLLLFVAYRLFWSWLFTLCALCFAAQIGRSLLVH